MQTRLRITPKYPFNLNACLRSHGWASLQPNAYLPDKEGLLRYEHLPGFGVVKMEVTQGAKDGGQSPLTVIVDSATPLTADARQALRKRVAHMLRLDEDLQPFYALCQVKGRPWSGIQPGEGLLVRSPSIYEDLVKVICTTNIQWGGTKRMAAEFVSAFGAPYGGDGERAFPLPEAVACVRFEEFTGRVRMGYRAAYVYELSVGAASGEIDLSHASFSGLTTEEIRQRLKAVKGVGDYAAASMLMLMGRYDFIAVDTVFRDFMKARYFPTGDYSESRALEVYQGWGEWKYLAYWFDMLKFRQQA